MQQSEIQNLVAILEEELVPALGCTEPIAIAYAGAKVREMLGFMPESAVTYCSGNIVKNVKSVTVPNSNGLRGIEAATTLGIVGGQPEKELEVLTGVTEAQIKETKALLAQEFCTTKLVANVDKLYIRVEVAGQGHTASVTIEGHHTNITDLRKDDTVLFHKDYTPAQAQKRKGDRTHLTLAGILEFAAQVPLEQIRPILHRQMEYNSQIADEGLSKIYGSGVAQAILNNMPHTPFTMARARAAAASEARMSGCALPVVINAGSGNQGIIVSVPVVTFARQMGYPDEKLYRALAVSNLTSIHIKRHIGDLSAFCGAITASCGVGAAIGYLEDCSYQVIADAISNNLASVGGIFCDGAKPSCAAKVASALDSMYISYCMARDNRAFGAGDGIVGADVEQTIRGIGRIGSVGMEETDQEILHIMMQTRASC